MIKSCSESLSETAFSSLNGVNGPGYLSEVAEIAKVEIIANPASAKDIRRLDAYGTCIDNLGKV